MKGLVTASIIQSLLLAVLSYSQGKCQLELDSVNFYIYNTTVEVKTYYCAISWDKNFECEKSYLISAKNTQASQNLSYYVDTCMSLVCTHPSEEGTNVCFDEKSKNVYYIILCESPGYVNLLEDNITLAYDTTYRTITRYEDGHYWLKARSHMVVWSPDSPQCEKLQYASNFFRIWKHRNGKKTYVANEYMSLQLTEKQTLCDTEVWTTNDDEIVVSKKIIDLSSVGKLQRYPDSCSFHEDCKTSTETQNRPGIIVEPSRNIPEPYRNATCEFENTYESQINCYVVIVVTLGVFYYLFNVIINFSLLWTFRKSQNGKIYLLNCISHSLTTRFLYFDLKNDEKTHVRLIPPSYGATQNHL